MVCQVCWATTQAFHELYEKSKEVQEEFLSSFVKREHEPVVIIWPTDSEENKLEDEDSDAEDNSIKVEQHLGETKSNKHHVPAYLHGRYLNIVDFIFDEQVTLSRTIFR